MGKIVIRKIQKGNSAGVSNMNIPSEFTAELGMLPGTYINIEKVGSSLHVTRVVIEGI